MKGLLLQANKLRLVGCIVMMLAFLQPGLAQTPKKDTVVKTHQATAKKKTNKGKVQSQSKHSSRQAGATSSKHKEIIHGSDNDKKLEEIKKAKNKQKGL